MKLRLRSIETKETLRLEIPNLSSIDHLKQTLAQSISAAPAALRLSLNRRDELLASSGQDSLHSLGVTSGDLVFYTLDPSSQTLARPPPPISHSSVVRSPIPISTAATAVGPQVPIFGNSETLIGESAAMDYDSIVEERRPVGSNSETLDASSAERMEIDDGPDEIGLEKYSEAFFSNRVLNGELGEEDCSNRKLLMVAVHAAVLDSGFIRFDSVSGLQVNRFPREDECRTRSISISYTLPEIMRNSCNNGRRVEGVVLKFQMLGRFVNVYGSLANGGSGPYLVRLDENIYAPVIKFVLKNRNVERRELMGFWKIVKDGITLPLLIDLCEKAGLPAPPNLTRLPPELKMKILEPLSGVALAKAGAVCKELRKLSNNDELWKQKYVEEFGGGSEGEGTVVNWKGKFGRNWEAREQQRKASTYRPYYHRRYNPRFRRREPPHPMFAPPFPGMIGGDYDRFPLFGVGDPTGPPHPLARPQINGRLPGGRRPSFAPNCDLGGFRG